MRHSGNGDGHVFTQEGTVYQIPEKADAEKMDTITLLGTETYLPTNRK